MVFEENQEMGDYYYEEERAVLFPTSSDEELEEKYEKMKRIEEKINDPKTTEDEKEQLKTLSYLIGYMGW